MKRFAASCLFACATAQAQVPANWPDYYPEWWHEHGLIDVTKLGPDSATAGDQGNHSLLLLGQLKHFAAAARTELDVQLAPIGGAGTEISTMVDGFTTVTPDNLSATNLGQLKNVAHLFYERFADIGFGPGEAGWPLTLPEPPPADPQYPDDYVPMPLNAPRVDGSAPLVMVYPWATNTGPANEEIALTGQAKLLYSWDVRAWTAVDTENSGAGDGLPDYWEKYWFDDLGVVPEGHGDADSLSNWEEYQNHTDPTSADTDSDGVNDDDELTIGSNPVDGDSSGLTVFIDGRGYFAVGEMPDYSPLVSK